MEFLAYIALGAGVLFSTSLLFKQGCLKIGWVNPVPGYKVTSGWGDSRSYLNTYHKSIDISAPEGTPIHAVISGIIILVDYGNPTAGNYIVQTIDQLPGCHVRYLHMNTIQIKKGQKVNSGQIIGTVGKTAAVNPHLHLDLLFSQLYVNRFINCYGIPKPGFDRPIGNLGIHVPPEPLIPVSGYTDSVYSNSKNRVGSFA